MTFRHLEIFVAVADSKSMTHAAEKLYISQPTVSQAIMELERHYGTKLFDRMNKRLYMTQAGEKLLGYARHVTSLVTDMTLQMTHAEQSGILRVGASATVGTLYLPKLVNAFKREEKNLAIQAVIKNTLDIEMQILKNELDIGLVEGDVHSEDLLVTPIEGDEIVLVCAKAHPLYHKGVIEPEDLRKQAFLIREVGSGTRELFEYAMAAMGLEWQGVWESSSFESMTAAALENIGIAVLSRELVGNELKNGRLKELDVPFLKLTRHWRVIYHKNKYLTEGMRQLIRLCLSDDN